jgi:hypothetical protein
LSDETEGVKRLGIVRISAALGWFILANIIFVFGMAELVYLYSNTVATGEEAVELDRMLSKELGGTVWVGFFIISALLTVRWTVSGFLPGTSKYKS